MSNQSGVYSDLIYASTVAGAAKATFTSEFKINDTATMGPTPVLLPEYFMPISGVGRGIHIIARGILSSTATPTYTFSIRLGAEGSTSAAIALGTAALTTGSGVTNQIWQLEGDVILKTFGAAGANSTLTGVGTFISSGTANKIDPAWGGGATPGTVATFDHSILNYVNVNVTCSSSSGSNSVTLQQLVIIGF